MDDPLCPIRFNEVMRTEHFFPPVFAALCSPDLLTAARRISKYKWLMSPQRMQVEVTRDSVTVTKEWIETALAPPVSLAVMELVFLLNLARLATRGAIRPLRVATTRPLRPAGAYEEYFGVPVRKGPQHLIRFSTADALRPFLTTDEAMWETFEPELRKRLAHLDESAGTGERVRAVLLEGLPSGRFSIEAVAATLAMSKRTLQWRLHNEGPRSTTCSQHRIGIGHCA